MSDVKINQISFRPLTVADLKLTYKWLQTNHVKQWYGEGKLSQEDIRKKYLPRVEGRDFTTCFVILYDSKPIGQIQMYEIADYPDYEKTVQLETSAAGVDLFIGESGYVHRGLGPIIIKKFLKDYVFKKLNVDICIIGPNPNNLTAIKAYEKVGFKYIKTIINRDGEEEYLMSKAR